MKATAGWRGFRAPARPSTRIARSLAMRDFLAEAGWGEAERRYFTGDASARSYETVTLAGEEPRVLMNSPRLVLGPPVRDGKPYAEIAHTAQSVAAFVAIDRALAKGGVAVPEIFAGDLDRGFLLISISARTISSMTKASRSPSATPPPRNCWRRSMRESGRRGWKRRPACSTTCRPSTATR